MTLPPLPSPTLLELIHEEDPLTIEWDVTPGLLARLFLRRRPGRARVVLQKGVLIWVPGDGRIPQVWRCDEIARVEASESALRFVLTEGKHRTLKVPGGFCKGDRAWLGGLLEDWRAAS